MSRKIFLGLLGLAIVLVSYQILSVSLRYAGIDKPDKAYLQAPEGANLSVVEFLDYGCVYCREMHPTISQAMREDGKIAYVPRLITPGDEKAKMAAKAAYAAARQGKFIEMHDALMKNYDMLDINTLSYIAGQAGVDVTILKKDMIDPEILAPTEENTDWLVRVGFNATPTFIIGKKIRYIPEGRMPTIQDFHNMFREARELWAIK